MLQAGRSSIGKGRRGKMAAVSKAKLRKLLAAGCDEVEAVIVEAGAVGEVQGG